MSWKAMKKKQRLTVDVPNETRDLEIKLELVKEARLLFGDASARFTWQMIGLPLVGARAKSYTLSRRAEVGEFLASRTLPDAQGEVRAGILYQEYRKWQHASGIPLLSLNGFGKAIAAAGIGKRKSLFHIYVGISLNPDPL
jgi:hypothetical protein